VPRLGWKLPVPAFSAKFESPARSENYAPSAGPIDAVAHAAFMHAGNLIFLTQRLGVGSSLPFEGHDPLHAALHTTFITTFSSASLLQSAATNSAEYCKHSSPPNTLSFFHTRVKEKRASWKEVISVIVLLALSVRALLRSL